MCKDGLVCQSTDSLPACQKGKLENQSLLHHYVAILKDTVVATCSSASPGDHNIIANTYKVMPLFDFH